MPMVSFSFGSAKGFAGLLKGSLTLVCVGTLALGCVARGWAAERPVTIPLEELGQQPVGARPQVPGSTVATVHWVGDHHVLVTFGVRRLMKRLEESRPEDEDRLIEAVLVDVPSGKVAARTTWRMHDGGEYLWDLGRGRFLLRVRDRLAVIAPLANLSTEHPFEEHHLLGYERRIVGVLVGAESDLLTVETVDPASLKEGAKRGDNLVEINFYRVEGEGIPERVERAGLVRSRLPIEIPMTSEGYLDTNEESKATWVFDYYSHAGKKIELAPFDTSCFPRATFVSRSEFVAFGCRGSQDKVEIGGFDMEGREMWQQNVYDNFVRATFSFAPESGRFAMGRAIMASPPSLAGPDPMGSQFTGQDVQVLQAHTGKQLFHMVFTPAQKSGENFSLSADGLRLALVRNGVVEIYKMPALSGKDEQEVKAARTLALDHALVPITLASRKRTTVTERVASMAPKKETVVTAPAADTAPAAVAAAADVIPPKQVEHTISVGDVPDDGPRKKPSLYNDAEPVRAGDAKPNDERM